MTLSWKEEFMSPNPERAESLRMPPPSPENEPYRLVDQAIVEMGNPMFRLWMRTAAVTSFGGKPMYDFFQHPSVAKLSMELGDGDDRLAYMKGIRATAWVETLGSPEKEEQADLYVESIAAIWLILKVFSTRLVHQDMDESVNEIGREWWMKNVPCVQEMLE